MNTKSLILFTSLLAFAAGFLVSSSNKKEANRLANLDGQLSACQSIVTGINPLLDCAVSDNRIVIEAPNGMQFELNGKRIK